jgi:hypothetical protein
MRRDTGGWWRSAEGCGAAHARRGGRGAEAVGKRAAPRSGAEPRSANIAEANPRHRQHERRSRAGGGGQLPAAPSLCQRPQDNAKHDGLAPLV